MTFWKRNDSIRNISGHPIRLLDGENGINPDALDAEAVSTGYRPLVDFMVIGAQKCGTTAFFEYLAQHPQIDTSLRKEVHLFDSPGYSRSWTSEEIDRRYRSHFQSASVGSGDHAERFAPDQAGESRGQNNPLGDVGTAAPSPELIRGEATPVYLFFPEIAGELKRYNPALKLIVLLRDPAERAISHYYMEKNRGYEKLPLWLALLCEPWRLWRCRRPRRQGSAWRRYSYQKRGRYRSQLRKLCQHFDEKQVLIIRTTELARRHDVVLGRVFRFLGVSEQMGIQNKRVFEGDWGGRRHRVVTWLLRLSFLPETVWMNSID